jgi:hypothetical protein
MKRTFVGTWSEPDSTSREIRKSTTFHTPEIAVRPFGIRRHCLPEGAIWIVLEEKCPPMIAVMYRDMGYGYEGYGEDFAASRHGFG